MKLNKSLPILLFLCLVGCQEKSPYSSVDSGSSSSFYSSKEESSSEEIISSSQKEESSSMEIPISSSKEDVLSSSENVSSMEPSISSSENVSSMEPSISSSEKISSPISSAKDSSESSSSSEELIYGKISSILIDNGGYSIQLLDGLKLNEEYELGTLIRFKVNTIGISEGEYGYVLNDVGYYLSSKGNSSFVKLTKDENDIYSFYLPGESVTLLAKSTRLYQIKIDASVSHIQFRFDEGKKYHDFGEKISFSVTLDEGYELSSQGITYTYSNDGYGDSTYQARFDASTNKYSFIMPSSDVTLKAIVEKIVIQDDFPFEDGDTFQGKKNKDSDNRYYMSVIFNGQNKARLQIDWFQYYPDESGYDDYSFDEDGNPDWYHSVYNESASKTYYNCTYTLKSDTEGLLQIGTEKDYPHGRNSTDGDGPLFFKVNLNKSVPVSMVLINDPTSGKKPDQDFGTDFVGTILMLQKAVK